MILRVLKYFKVCAEEGSFSKASKVLHIAQPPLSKQIKKLEDDYNVQLFTRTSSGLKLTETGEYLKKRVDIILDEVEETKKELRKFSNNSKMFISLGSVPTCSDTLLAEWISLASGVDDAVEYQTFEGDSNILFNLLDNHDIDAAIVRQPIDKEKYDYIVLTDEPTCIAVSKDSKLAHENKGVTIKSEELKKEKLIVPNRMAGIMPLDSTLKRDLKFTLTCRSVTQALSMARKNIGVAIVPKSAQRIQSLSENLVFYKIVSPTYYSKIVIIWRKGDVLHHSLESTFPNLVKRIPEIFNI